MGWDGLIWTTGESCAMVELRCRLTVLIIATVRLPTGVTIPSSSLTMARYASFRRFENVEYVLTDE
jgi:hypothetical protein